jgi:hypothetical protein
MLKISILVYKNMGLDAVEIIMGWEQAFEIEITDAEAETIRTPRTAIDLITSKLEVKENITDICPLIRTYYRVQQALQAVLNLQQSQIQPDSKLRHLLPQQQRSETWQQIRSYLGVPKLPKISAIPIFMPITVQDLVDWLTAHYPSYFISPDERWTHQQIRTVVRAVIKDVVGTSGFTDDNDFVKEIGVS